MLGIWIRLRGFVILFFPNLRALYRFLPCLLSFLSSMNL